MNTQRKNAAKTLPKKYRVYELDFGDQNLLSENEEEITNWIQTDMCDMQPGDELNYTITIRMMTRKEIKDIPEWGS